MKINDAETDVWDVAIWVSVVGIVANICLLFVSRSYHESHLRTQAEVAVKSQQNREDKVCKVSYKRINDSEVRAVAQSKIYDDMSYTLKSVDDWRRRRAASEKTTKL